MSLDLQSQPEYRYGNTYSGGRLYTRVFASILDSSINVQSVPPSVRWLWITMLLIADGNRTGVVDMPVERLAARAGLTLDQTREGLAVLSAPDPESTSDEEEGRRLVPIREDSTRGWKLVNWEKYRALAKEEQRREQTRHRVAAFRSKSAGNVDVTHTNASVTPSEEKEHAEEEARSPSSRKRSTTPSFDDDSQEMRAAKYLFGKIKTNNEEAKEPNFQSWARTFDAIFRLDHRNTATVYQIIDFSQSDDFWWKNILSPDKLREKFDKLKVASMKSPRVAKPQPQQTVLRPYKTE